MKILKSRKSVLIVLVVCIAVLLLLAQSVSAADGVKLSAGTVTGISGKNVTVTVSIANAKDSEGGQFELVFDPDIVEPVKITKGKFVEDANNNQFMTNLELDDDRLMVIWVTPEGDTADSGVVCTIEFKLLDDGDTNLTFEGVVVAPDDAEVAPTHTAGKVTAEDPAVAKQRAIDAADDAIAALPDPEDITLADKDDVEEARELVEKAKDEHGAVDADFDDLDKLVDAEEMIAKLEAIKAADDAIAALPTVDNLTLDDKAAVVAARALVNTAKSDHGAVDDDFANLDKLKALENRIAELEGLKPTPPTGGMNYWLLLGLAVIFVGLPVLIRRSRPVFH